MSRFLVRAPLEFVGRFTSVDGEIEHPGEALRFNMLKESLFIQWSDGLSGSNRYYVSNDRLRSVQSTDITHRHTILSGSALETLCHF